MDTSEEYVRMCKKAKEIQKVWNPENGDFYFDLVNERVYSYCSSAIGKGYTGIDVWLPRQDQLQEMITDGLAWKHVLFDEFVRNQEANWITGEIKNFGSFEQLWLAFVMYRKFNKIWDGEKWVEE